MNGPCLIAIGGHTGTGKTVLAYRLRAGVPALAGALVLDCDQERRERLGYALAAAMRPEDYAPEITEEVRTAMDEKMTGALAAGRSVIDASGFFTSEGRAAIEALAASCGVAFFGLWLTAPREVMEKRIAARLDERASGKDLSLERGHASDACLGVIDKFGDIGLPESRAWVLLEASGSPQEVFAAARERLSL